MAKTPGARERALKEEPERPLVTVCIVTYDSVADLPDCLAAVVAQDYRPLELVVVDCASSDDSAAVARRCATPGVSKEVIALTENRGFAGGMNEALGHARAPFVLSLNADARPRPDYVRRLLARLEQPGPWRLGAATGHLLRPAPDRAAERRIDACGMRLVRAWRHLDRGSGELDQGQWDRPERVFGATGAASLFRRAALVDVSVDGETFDAAFHSFREDAELCFRLQERGWEIAYEPTAIAEHRRRVLPERRRRLPAAINYHSLKNRYLLRFAHQTWGNLWRTLGPTLWRDVLALAYVLAFERASLAAYGWLWRHRHEILARRRSIQSRRTQDAIAIDRWFSHQGFPLPALELAGWEPSIDHR